MSEQPALRVSPAWIRALLPVALAIAVTMILLSVVDATKTERRLPPQVGFIPVESRIFAITSSLDGLWSNLGNHAARLAAPEPESFWSDVNASLRQFSEHCVAFESAADLSSAGLDPARGLSVALLGDRPDLLATLPVSNRDVALETFSAALSSSAVPVWLSPSIPGSDVIAYGVTLEKVENAVLCALPESAPFNGRPRLLTGLKKFDLSPVAGANPVAEELFLAPRGAGPTRLALTCEALLRDGTSQPCKCEVNFGDSCDEPYELETGASTLRLLDDPSHPEAGQEPVWATENELFFGFADERLLIASRPNLIRSAAGRRQERSTRLLGDNALLGLVNQFHAGARAGDATMLGLVRGIKEPVAGALPFAITSGRDRILVRAALPLETLRIDELDRLIAPPSVQPPGATAGAPLVALLNDAAAGTYFNLADQLYGILPFLFAPEDGELVEVEPDEELMIEPPIPLDETFEVHIEDEPAPPDCAGPGDDDYLPSLFDALGDFSPLVQGLAGLKEIGPIEGYLLDVRDGVPEIVLVQHGLEPAVMERLIDDTRYEMKLSRDSEVLCQARAQFWLDSGGTAFPVHPGSLLPYLGEEGPDLLERYTLQEEYIAPDPLGESLGDSKLDARTSTGVPARFDFSIPEYRNDFGRFDIHYVPPPVTDLDLRYRLDLQNNGELDADALRNDAFRLAYAWRVDGAVAFGTDARTLSRFLAVPAQPPATVGRTSEDKLLVAGNPEHLVTLALLYPQGDIRSLVTTGGFEVLDQYRKLELSVRPAAGFDGLTLDLELVHD